MSLDRGIHQSRREPAVVELLLHHIAHCRGAECVGGRENRHDRPRARIAAGALPRKVEEADQPGHSAQRDQRRAPVGKEPSRLCGRGGGIDHALGESDRDGQSLAWFERGRGRDANRPCAFVGHYGVSRRLALISGVNRTLPESRR